MTKGVSIEGVIQELTSSNFSKWKLFYFSRIDCAIV